MEDKKPNMSELRKIVKKSRVKFPRLRLTVLKKEGYCYHGYEVGDQFIFETSPTNLLRNDTSRLLRTAEETFNLH